MKKLGVLLVTLFVLLASATASFAATVGFTGEFNLGYCLEDGLQGPTTLNGKPTDIKLYTNVKVNDQVSGVAYFRAQNYGLANGSSNGDQFTNAYGVYIDQAYMNFITDFATFKVGRFATNVKDSVDILNGILYTGDYKDGFGVQAQFGIVKGLNAKIFASSPTSASATPDSSALTPVVTTNDKIVGDYGASLVYAGSNFGGSVNVLSLGQENLFAYRNGWSGTKSYAKWNPIFAVNAYVMPVTSTKLYLHYGQAQDQNNVAYPGSSNLSSTIIGVSFDDANTPVYARAEYDFQKGVSNQGSYSPLGFRIGYKLGGGVSMEYDRLQQADDKYDAGAGNYNLNYIKFKMVF